MTAQQLFPDAILAATNLSGAVTAIDEDPDSPDANWLTAPGSNNATEVRVSFPTPAGTLTGSQEFRVRVRKTAHSTNPSAVVELYENGSLVATVVASTTVSSTTGAVLSGTWNASALASAAGANVECRVVGTVGGGSPGNRASVEVGAIEWNANYSIITTVPIGLATEADAGLAMTAVSGAEPTIVAIPSISAQNLLAGVDANIEAASTADFSSPFACTVTTSTVDVFSGTRTLSLEDITDIEWGVFLDVTPDQVTPGSTFQVRVRVLGNRTFAEVGVRANWVGDPLNPAVTNMGGPFGDWGEVIVVSPAAPVGATTLRLNFYGLDEDVPPAPGDRLAWDGFELVHLSGVVPGDSNLPLAATRRKVKTLGLATETDSASPAASTPGFVGAHAHSPNGSSTTTITNNVPAGIADDDLLLWSVTGNSETQPTTPSGWEVWQPVITQAGHGITIFSRRVPDALAEPASHSITLTAGKWSGTLVAYHDVDPTTPLDAAIAFGPNDNPRTVTTVTPNALVVIHGRGLTASGVTNTDWDSSTGTVRIETTQTSAVTNITQAAADQLQATPGDVTPSLVPLPEPGSESRIVSALRPVAVSTITPLLVPPSGGTAIGLASEADEALATTRQKVKALGLVTETDETLAPTRRKAAAFGQPAETNESLALGKRKTTALGLVTETDDALAVTKVDPQLAILGLATEASAPLAAARRKVVTLGLASETDAGLAVTPFDGTDTLALGIATETSEVLALAKTKAKALGLPLETDEPLSITRGAVVIALGLGAEADTVEPLARTKIKALGLGSSADTAVLLGARKTKALGLGSEAEAGLTLISLRGRALGLVEEADTGQPLAHRKTKALGLATETDETLPVTIYDPGVIVVALGLASELAEALAGERRKSVTLDAGGELAEAIPPSRVKIKSLATATSTEESLGLSRRKTAPLGLAASSEQGLAPARAKQSALGAAGETDEAPAQTRVKHATLGQAAETDAALPLGTVLFGSLGVANETDEPLAPTARKSRTPGLTSENDTTSALTVRKVVSLGTASEIAEATALERTKAKALSVAVELDESLGVTRFDPGEQIGALGLATEDGAVLPATRRKVATLGTPSEAGEALPVTRLRAVTLGQLAETAEAFGLAALKRQDLGLATETDAGLVLTNTNGRRDVTFKVSRPVGHRLVIRPVGPVLTATRAGLALTGRVVSGATMVIAPAGHQLVVTEEIT